MQKNFLFINISINSGYHGVNHGVAFLAPIVKKHSYRVKYIDITADWNAGQFNQAIEAFQPSVIAFSCTSHQLKYLTKFSGFLEERSDILTIAGGVGVTLDPEWVIKKTSVDAVCIGEGEIPIENLLHNISSKKELRTTEGFYFRNEKNAFKNPPPQFIRDISLLRPDYTIFAKKAVLKDGRINLMLGRGCVYNCNYCSNKALSSVYSSAKGYFRLPPVEQCIDLIKGVLEDFPEVTFINFLDDLLISNKIWFKQFAHEYGKIINLPYTICVRAESISSEIVDAMKNSGCKKAQIGLESGNEELRKTILNRSPDNDFIIEKCRMVQNAGIELYTFNVVGFPDEQGAEMEETYNLNKRIAPSGGVCTFFYPYKKTALYEICKKRNRLLPEDDMLDITNYLSQPSIKMNAAEKKTCIFYQEKIMSYMEKQLALTEESNQQT
jgi:radical SAM superfamily enzyme YgiQ (UPF0313 family)